MKHVENSRISGGFWVHAVGNETKNRCLISWTVDSSGKQGMYSAMSNTAKNTKCPKFSFARKNAVTSRSISIRIRMEGVSNELKCERRDRKCPRGNLKSYLLSLDPAWNVCGLNSEVKNSRSHFLYCWGCYCSKESYSGCCWYYWFHWSSRYTRCSR